MDDLSTHVWPNHLTLARRPTLPPCPTDPVPPQPADEDQDGQSDDDERDASRSATLVLTAGCVPVVGVVSVLARLPYAYGTCSDGYV